MTEPPLPSVLRRRRRRSLLAAGVLLGLTGLAVWADASAAPGYGVVDEPGERSTWAEVVAGPDGTRQLSYEHPATSQRLQVPLVVWALETPEVGDRVRVVADHDPLHLQLVGDRFGPEVNLGLYVTLAVPALLVLAVPRVAQRRTARLVRADTPAFSMVGVLGRRSGLGRTGAVLHLYALDAAPGAEPVCTVPVANVGPVGYGVPFLVEVKGSPRPRGRVVARAGEVVLWPTRAAIGRAGPPRPLGPAIEVPEPETVERPLRPWDTGGAVQGAISRAAAPMLAAAVLLVVVAVATLRNESSTQRFTESAEPVIAEVVAHVDSDVVMEVHAGQQDRWVVRAHARGDYPIGTRLIALVDPSGGTRARLAAEPYSATEPIVWAGLPLVGVLAYLGGQLVLALDSARAARRGPFRRQRARIETDGNRVRLILLDPSGAPIGTVPTRARDWWVAGGQHRVPAREQPVTVAGVVGPGAAVAVWREDGTPVVTTGAVGAAHHDGGAALPVAAPQGDGPIVLPLARGRFTRRSPVAVIEDGTVALHLPTYFGSRAWTVPISHIGVRDLTAVAPPSDEPLVLRDGLRLAYPATAANHAPPTTFLLFTAAQRVPPLRMMAAGGAAGFGYRRSRSADGVHLDGVLLRFEEPAHAAAVLRDAGAEWIADETAWIRRHHEVLSDPAEIDAAVRDERRLKWLNRISLVSLLAAGVGAQLLDRLTGITTALIVGWLALTLLLPVVVTARVRRARQRQISRSEPARRSSA